MISVDKVIATNLPQLTNSFKIKKLVKKSLSYLLHEQEFTNFATAYPHLQGIEFVEQVLDELDFDTRYKAKQIETISRMFCEGTVKEGDHFLFADAWHPGIISLKYMSELLQVPVKIHSMWHAGSYDPHDFLGRLIHDKQWTFDFERSIFHASDYNYFATKFHIKMFVKNLSINVGKLLQIKLDIYKILTNSRQLTKYCQESVRTDSSFRMNKLLNNLDNELILSYISQSVLPLLYFVVRCQVSKQIPLCSQLLNQTELLQLHYLKIDYLEAPLLHKRSCSNQLVLIRRVYLCPH